MLKTGKPLFFVKVLLGESLFQKFLKYSDPELFYFSELVSSKNPVF